MAKGTVTYMGIIAGCIGSPLPMIPGCPIQAAGVVLPWSAGDSGGEPSVEGVRPQSTGVPA